MILGIYRADGSFESRKDISRECIIWPHERSQFHKPRKMANRGSAGERGGLSPIPSKSAHNFFCCNFEDSWKTFLLFFELPGGKVGSKVYRH